MKKLFFLLTLLCLKLTADPLKTESEIEKVTVFLNGAQINRMSDISIPKGTSEIYFENLSAKLNPESIQLSSDANLMITDVKHERYQPNAPDPGETMPEAARLEIERITEVNEDLDYQMRAIAGEEEILKAEQKLIKNIRLLQTGTDSLELLQSSLDYYHVKYVEIINRLLELDKQKKKANKAKLANVNEINEIHKKHKVEVDLSQKYRIIASVNSSFPIKAKFNLNYMVYDAYWKPAYDIRAEEIDSPIKINYKGNVVQNTGIDWEGVKLTVSTSNPSQNKNRPILNPWYVDFFNPNFYRDQNAYNLNSYIQKDESTSLESVKEKSRSIPAAADYKNIATVVQNNINVQYQMDVEYNIPSDGMVHSVQMTEEEVDAEFQYHSVPKLDCRAFLLAKIKEWGDLNLLAGDANLFFDGIYVGKTYIDPNVINDELLLSLGVDEKVSVKRYKLETDASHSFFGGNKTEVFTYEISIRNNKNESITMDLLDQIPLSHNEEIEISLVDANGADYTKDYGKLLWDVEIGPNSIKKFKFKYSVKYPEDKTVGGI